MSILLAQLGDIHFKETTDPVYNRASQIAATISAEVTAGVTSVVIAICGDATFSGTKKQFSVARGFIEAIENEIRRRHASVPITRVMVPGNHDCDFSGDQAARDFMLTAIKESETPAESVCKVVLSPLKEYFNFAANVVGEMNAITESHRFYHHVDLQDGESTLRLHLLNTAWMSSLHEQPGSLHFPLAEIEPPGSRVDCAFAILHHPTHWFSQPHAMRPLRDKLSELASVILVNHEHVPEATESVPLFERDGSATNTVYVSGGVVQESWEPELCNFNLLNIDVAGKSVQLTRHEYRSNGSSPYFERTENVTIDLSLCGLNVGPAGASLQDTMVEFLNDPGAPITHPNRDPRIPIRLRDVFLYPDLWELDTNHEGKDQKQIKSGDVPQEVLASERILITGEEKCGRTAIVKSLFTAAFESGKVPVYLNGGDIPKNTDKLRRSIRSAVKDHYSNFTPDQFEQLDRADRVVLVDDVHRMAPATSVRRELLQALERQFGTVVLCGDDLIKMDEMGGADARDSGLWEYRHLIILGFGEYLREEFVKQWLMLGGDTVPDDGTLLAEVDRICGLLNVVIKKQLLPAYPLFLLVILQQTDLATASVQNGSFGKLFEGLITAILNKSQFHRISISDKYYYLAALSKKMFDEKSMSLPLDVAKKWHRSYWDEIELDIDFDRLTNDLKSLGVLAVSGSELHFRYVYFFCFFVAYHLNRTLHEEETRQLIKHLSRHLHHRVSADIILFLAHLTGDPIVLNEMVETCDSLFQDVTPANLESDVEPLNRLGQVVESVSIPDTPDENRRKMKLNRDAVVAERLAATKSTHQVIPPEPDNEAIKKLFDIHAAYKTIQILGQALRNVAGSASKGRKEEVIEKIVGLSRRVLGVYLHLFSNDVLPELIRDMAAAHKEEQPELEMSDLHREVCQHLNGLSQFICFSMIRHTTYSVGSENLAPTIRRVLGESQEAIAKMLDLSFDLEKPNRFPKESAIKLYRELAKNHFSASVVRILIAHHLYLYVVPVQDRQAVCEKMDIKLLPSVFDRTRKRLTK